ncbi:ankyrin repeat domain-containing protein [Streptomyces sp. NPDC047002]|uniref:ankyrin repeat domain-containing protein n=1 Tax=Streptomyces sp. NPDC047002 TaxID=3155475 RepID=UPI0034568D8F
MPEQSPTAPHPSAPAAARATAPAYEDGVVALAGTLFGLARAGDDALLARYLAAGAPPNLTNTGGDTLLMLAAYHGHADTVALLLRHRADPDRVNDRGQSPLGAAVFKDEPEIVGLLLDAGADPGLGSPSARGLAEFFGRDAFLRRFAGPAGGGTG